MGDCPQAHGMLELKDMHDTPMQLRWSPFDVEQGKNFVTGMKLLCGSGSPQAKEGLAIFIYSGTQDMPAKQCFYSADGDMLIVPQEGGLDIQTELGRLTVEPSEIVVIPRGVRFRVASLDSESPSVRGYILEIFGPNHFQLPELGVIGSSGCANARDFQIPTAFFEEDYTRWEVIAKYAGKLFKFSQDHTPFDVVGWHGNYYPYKYDLKRFNTINTVSYDHLVRKGLHLTRGLHAYKYRLHRIPAFSPF